MYTYALANPKAEFKSVGEKLGDFTAHFNEVGKLIDKHGDLVFPRCDTDWELVPQEIPWQEALEQWVKGKSVIRELNGTTCLFTKDNCFGVSRKELINGKWFLG